MKRLKQIIKDIKAAQEDGTAVESDLLWQLICYSPKMPVRLLQQNLLDEATRFSLKVYDAEFSAKELRFNAFKWGSGKHKVLLTHGWGSKAIDFSELITALRILPDAEIVAFDAPGNGSSEGDLSNLGLYVQAVEAIIRNGFIPEIVIGHSLGAMANTLAIYEIGILPSLLISLTPLIRLKENFQFSMDSVGVKKSDQDDFFERFEQLFKGQASTYNLVDLYQMKADVKHWIAFDSQDLISPYAYIAEFLLKNPSVASTCYEGVGHDKIFKATPVISDLLWLIKVSIQTESRFKSTIL
ncbi:alpha/beta hydrolase [Arcticibacter eurypsychrophilus]|uniref:alpha/beta hydrolase n=1 Tax=Arcticibacter eurypsychrophilus TaxID=1434752 RepID=UPI00084D8F60|nr:alpha/beta hydrolase [Arcticibacter eurypsychrophilus]